MVEYPSSVCADSPTSAHYYLKLAGYDIWRCKYCWTTKWLPGNWYEARDFSMDCKRFGKEGTYRRKLSCMPKTVKALEKLEEIRLLRDLVTGEELEEAVVAIFTEIREEVNCGTSV